MFFEWFGMCGSQPGWSWGWSSDPIPLGRGGFQGLQLWPSSGNAEVVPQSCTQQVSHTSGLTGKISPKYLLLSFSLPWALRQMRRPLSFPKQSNTLIAGGWKGLKFLPAGDFNGPGGESTLNQLRQVLASSLQVHEPQPCSALPSLPQLSLSHTGFAQKFGNFWRYFGGKCGFLSWWHPQSFGVCAVRSPAAPLFMAPREKTFFP